MTKRATGEYRNLIAGKARTVPGTNGYAAGRAITVTQDGEPATVYADELLTTPIESPSTNRLGFYRFYAKPGTYDVAIADTHPDDAEAEWLVIDWDPGPAGAGSIAELEGVDLTGAAEGDVLTIDSEGLVVPAQSGTSALVLVGETVLTSTASAFTFSGIPATHHDLLIVARLRSDKAASFVDHVLLRLGSGAVDSGANYRWGYGVIRGDAVAEGLEGEGATSMQIGEVPAASADAGSFGVFKCRILDYTSTTMRRGVIAEGGILGDPGGTAASARQAHGTGEWTNATDAVTNLSLSLLSGPNFIAGSWVRVYAVGVDPT